MIKLTINNSYSKIEGLNLKQEQELKVLMSYTLPQNVIHFSGRYGPQTKTLLSKRGDFPTGLLYIVSNFLYGNNYNHVTQDNRIQPKSNSNFPQLKLSFKPYVEQEEAAKMGRMCGRGIIVAPTGIGKSVIAALLIDRLKVPTLVVVPTLNLKKQLSDAFKAMFGEGSVGGVKDGLPIAVENIDALPVKQEFNIYKALIIDEFHHSGAKTYRDLNKYAWKGIYYKFGLTATAFRSQDHERLLLESVLSEVIYQLDYQTSVDKNYIVPMEAYYYTLSKIEIKGNQRSWASMYNELVVNNLTRNQLIADILTKLSGESTLCLVKEIEHGRQLVEMIKVPFLHGESENGRITLLEFLLDVNKQLIGTTGVLGEGVDTKPAEFIIIAGLGKSKNAFMQQVGRGFRKYKDKKSCKIIIFKDKSHRWTLNHFKEQCRILKEEYGIVPIEVPN